jgi:rod shape-determining protein MreB and related proteins
VQGVTDLLERTPPELSADIAERGLMLVGGGALMPGLDELIRHETGLSVTIEDEPLTTVARGAGKALEELSSGRPKRSRHPRRPRFS